MLSKRGELFSPLGLLMEFRVLRPPPPSLVLGFLVGLVFRLGKEARIPRIATPAVTEIRIT